MKNKYDDYENGKIDGFNEGYIQALKDAALETINLEKRITRLEVYVEQMANNEKVIFL